MTGDRSPPQLCFSLSWQDSSFTAAVLIFRSGRLVGQAVVALLELGVIGHRPPVSAAKFLDSVVRTSMGARIQSGSEARGTCAFIVLMLHPVALKLSLVGDIKIEASQIQHGEARRLVMSAPTPLRQDFDAPQVRGLARKTKDGPQARRLLALAAIYDGATRTEAAKIGGVGLQI